MCLVKKKYYQLFEHYHIFDGAEILIRSYLWIYVHKFCAIGMLCTFDIQMSSLYIGIHSYTLSGRFDAVTMYI